MRFLIRPVVFSVLCFFVCLLYTVYVVSKNKPRLNQTRPFPSNVQGVTVVWIPDLEARATLHGLTENSIKDVTLYRGGPWSRLPQSVVVRDKRAIRAFIKGIKAAVKRSDNIYWKRRSNPQGLVSGGMIPHDSLVIHPATQTTENSDRFELTLPFSADVIEGESYYLERGTVSPEFQEALRRVGVPLPGTVHGSEKFVYDTWLETAGA